jgi:hypothetical protein
MYAPGGWEQHLNPHHERSPFSPEPITLHQVLHTSGMAAVAANAVHEGQSAPKSYASLIHCVIIELLEALFFLQTKPGLESPLYWFKATKS